jgi:hypothetical protein
VNQHCIHHQLCRKRKREERKNNSDSILSQPYIVVCHLGLRTAALFMNLQELHMEIKLKRHHI